jgi:hypothetical protein
MKAVADRLDVSRSNLHERVSGKTKPRRRYHKAQDAALLPLIERLVAKRPTYGYRRITAVLNRKLRTDSLVPVNHKRVYRIMKAHNLLMVRKYTERPEEVHDGKVVVMRSNLRLCSVGFEFTCWNGEVVRFGHSFGPVAFVPSPFIIDAHDREVITWRVVVNAGISGSDALLRMMLGGRAAETVVFDEVSSGAGGGEESDLAMATQLLIDAETRLGLGETLTWHSPDITARLLAQGSRTRIEDALRTAESEARNALTDHRADLDRIAKALLDKRELTAKDLTALLDPVDPDTARDTPDSVITPNS